MPRDDLSTLLTSILDQIKEVRSDIKDLNDKQDKQSERLQSIAIQTTKTNGRVTKLENEKGRKLNIPTNVIYLIALGCIIALVIVAKLMNINLGGLL